MFTLHVIADSISMHYGPYLGEYLSPWCHYSRKGSRIGDIENVEGVNGQDSPMVLTYVERCIATSQHWNAVLVNCGLWDIRDRDGVLQTDIADYASNLELIFDRVPRISERAVWVRTTPVDDERHNSLKSDYLRHDADVVRYNAVADDIARRHGVPLIDLYAFCRSLGLEAIYLDHIHFTEDTRRLQAAFVAGQAVSMFGLASDFVTSVDGRDAITP